MGEKDIMRLLYHKRWKGYKIIKSIRRYDLQTNISLYMGSVAVVGNGTGLCG